MMPEITSTTCLPLPAGPHDALLDAMGHDWGRLERKLHVALRKLDRGKIVEGGPTSRNDLKKKFCLSHDITARQYNSLIRSLDGKHASILTLSAADAKRSAVRLEDTQKKIAVGQKKVSSHIAAVLAAKVRALAGKLPTKAQVKVIFSEKDFQAIKLGIRGRKTKAAKLEVKIARLLDICSRKVTPIVFGTRKLLCAQPDAEDPAFVGWKASWVAARSSEIFCVGTKDEPGGSQSCSLLWGGWDDGMLALRLRRLGKNPTITEKYLAITGIPLTIHARAVLGKMRDLFAKGGSAAVTVRFKRQEGEPANGVSAWQINVTVAETVPEAAFDKGQPVLGVDVNSDHLAWALSSADGNLLRTGRINLPLHGKTSEARSSLICEAASHLVKVAVKLKAQIAIEDLDFADKREQNAMKPVGARRRRMLSSFSYAAILGAITRRAARVGIAVKSVNPAYTSIIGKVNFSARHGISTHRAAAFAIARRSLCHSERVYDPSSLRDIDLAKSAEKPRRHVWVQWVSVRRALVRLAAVARKSGRSRGEERFRTFGSASSGRRKVTCHLPKHPSAPEMDWIPDFP